MNFNEFLQNVYNGEEISIDSRTLKENDIFVAIREAGHVHVAEAFKKGAKYAIVEERYMEYVDTFSGCFDEMIVVCDDSLSALKSLGYHMREISKESNDKKGDLKIIGITGSVGKTTTRTWLSNIIKGIEGEESVCSSEKNYNTIYGIPMSMARMNRETIYGIFEMGTNHKGEIKEVCDYVDPDITLITNIRESHIGMFHSYEELKNEKLSVIDSMREGTTLIFNGDCSNSLISEIKNRAREKNIKTISVGFGSWNNVRITYDYVDYEKNMTMVCIKIGDKNYSFWISAVGMNYTIMISQVVGVLYALGYDIDQFIDHFKRIRPLEGRGAIKRFEIERRDEDDDHNNDDDRYVNHREKIITIIDDSYNSSPTSMEVSIENMNRRAEYYDEHNIKGIRKVCIMGEMGELGEFREMYHENIFERLRGSRFDVVVYFGGEETRSLIERIVDNKNLVTFSKVDEKSIEKTIGLLENRDIVLVKGSRSVGLDLIIDSVRLRRI